MSRLWSRLGARTAAVALLSVGVAGGFYLGEDRQSRPSDTTAQVGLVEYEPSQYAQVEFVVESARYQRELRAEQRARAAAELAARKAAAERAARLKREAEEKAAREAAERAAKPYDGPIPESCNEYSGNRAIGCALLLDTGFNIDQMPCLDRLWKKESGWNHKASNPSGAYGIPQARPGNKMATVGDDWRTNPATQIKWGLGYIKGRYGTPCNAWAHSQNTGWY